MTMFIIEPPASRVERPGTPRTTTDEELGDPLLTIRPGAIWPQRKQALLNSRLPNACKRPRRPKSRAGTAPLHTPTTNQDNERISVRLAIRPDHAAKPHAQPYKKH